VKILERKLIEGILNSLGTGYAGLGIRRRIGFYPQIAQIFTDCFLFLVVVSPLVLISFPFKRKRKGKAKCKISRDSIFRCVALPA